MKQRIDSLIETSSQALPPTNMRAHLQAIIARLQIAASSYQLKDRHICVLSIIASFARDTTGDGRIIVFASNEALCRRGYGMDVQRLQRALRDLVAAGLITRKLSPNGKRYVHRNSNGVIVDAFGFDLSPLLLRQTEIHNAAVQTENLKKEIDLWRDKLSSLRHLDPTCSELLAEIRAELRRKPDLPRLQNRFDELSARYDHNSKTTNENLILTPNAYQNDMHYQSSIQNNIIEQTLEIKPSAQTINLHEVIDLCSEAMSFSEDPPKSWQDLDTLATRLAPMIGISHIQTKTSRESLGQERFTLTILCLVQRLKHIRQPAAYLAKLVHRAASYSAKSFLLSLRSCAGSTPAFTR